MTAPSLAWVKLQPMAVSVCRLSQSLGWMAGASAVASGPLMRASTAQSQMYLTMGSGSHTVCSRSAWSLTTAIRCLGSSAMRSATSFCTGVGFRVFMGAPFVGSGGVERPPLFSGWGARHVLQLPCRAPVTRRRTPPAPSCIATAAPTPARPFFGSLNGSPLSLLARCAGKRCGFGVPGGGGFSLRLAGHGGTVPGPAFLIHHNKRRALP